MTKQALASSPTFVPPVVSVLGHVDHGKTTLLDAFRKSDIARGEHGGITQKIGASEVTVKYEGEDRVITFIDTPGHAAFANMRSRGARVADIALLIVSSVDGVMPQTKESIALLKTSHVPFVVVLTKVDSEEKNIDKVKQQLAREEVLIEGYGGDVPVIEVSARAGTGVKELLDLILLVWSMQKHEQTTKLEAIVIESRLDPKAGPKATVIVKSGTLKVKDEVVADTATGKIRSLITPMGTMVSEVSAGHGAEVLGFAKVPPVGTLVLHKDEVVSPTTKEVQKKQFEETSDSMLKLILCADTIGSLEAITTSLPKEVTIMQQKTGEISEADILFAKQIGALILTFNIRLKPDIVKFALLEKVLLKNYTIIYEMLDEIQQVLEGKALALEEQIYGVAKIQATFPFEKSIVLGIVVLDGRVAKGDKVRIMREDVAVGESHIVSLRQGKEVVSKVEKGKEAGILISPKLDFTIGDMILSHS